MNRIQNLSAQVSNLRAQPRRRPRRRRNVQQVIPYVVPRPIRRSRQPRSFLVDPFVATLNDPENVTGVKWPAPTAVPTGTFTQTVDILAAADANGNYAIAVAPDMLGTNAIGGYLNPASIAANGAITWTGGSYYNFPSSTTAALIYDEYRVVSGCIKCEYYGSTTNDAGLLVGAWDLFGGTNNSSTLITNLNNQYATQNAIFSKGYSESYPLRNGICIKWRPADFTAANFLPTIVGTGGNHAFLMLSVIGMAPNAAGLKLRIIFNYEGLAANDTASFISSTTNPGSQDSITKATQWGASLTDKIIPLFGVMSDSAMKNNQLRSVTDGNIRTRETQRAVSKIVAKTQSNKYHSGNSLMDSLANLVNDQLNYK